MIYCGVGSTPHSMLPRRRSSAMSLRRADVEGNGRRSATRAFPSHADFALNRRLVFQVVVAPMSAHQRAVGPVLQDSTHVFTGEAGHSREVALRDLLPD